MSIAALWKPLNGLLGKCIIACTQALRKRSRVPERLFVPDNHAHKKTPPISRGKKELSCALTLMRLRG